MQKLILPIAFVLLIQSLVFADPEIDAALSYPEEYTPSASNDELLQEANEAYRNNNLEKALSGYQYLVTQDIQNGYLFYNLGNTYFRMGELGPAILWYERALAYKPRYNDLRVNLNYARQQTVDEEFKGPSPGATARFFNNLHQSLNLRETLILTLIIFWIFIILIVLNLYLQNETWRGRFRIPCWIMGLVFIISLLSSGLKIYRYEFIKEAIIMDSAVEIKTAPSDEYSTAFTLHEGTTVIVKQRQNDWVRITLPGNQAFTGWVPDQSLEII